MAAEFEVDDAEHFGFGGGLAGPDFELACALLDEHFKPEMTARPRALASLRSGVSSGL